ncbi:DUF6115 domain-containing protein [Thalassorhabdus alkalitolerans]
MIYFLICISLSLHLLSFYIILIFYRRWQKEAGILKDSHRLTSEIEDLLVAYTAEMKEDNERLLKELEQKTPRSDATHHDPGNRKAGNNEKDSKRIESSRPDHDSFHKEMGMPYIPNQKDKVVQSPAAKALSLFSKGLDRDEIAKELDMGKGEVELLLKFYK